MYIVISMAAEKQFNKIQHNFIINTFDKLIGKTKKKKKGECLSSIQSIKRSQ